MTAMSFHASRRYGEDFRHSEMVVVAFGAAAFGLMFGAVLAVAVGRVYPPVAAATILLLYVYAFHLASQSFSEILQGRQWFDAALFTLHVLAFGLWPFAVMLFAPSTMQFWFGLLMLLGTLAAFLILGRPTARVVYRTGAQSALLGGLTAYQGVLMSIGS